jgi:hypothetical protein
MKSKLIRSKVVLPLAAIALLGSAFQAQATSILVDNFSFETTIANNPITDWGLAGGGWATFNFAGYISPPATHGSTAAYSNGGTIYQILDSHVIAQGTYTIRIDLGQRSDTPFGGFGLSVFSVNGPNGVVGLGGFNLPADPPVGGWSTLTAVVPIGNASLAIGGNLQLNLNSAGTQTLADNVRVDFTAVPEPTSLTLALAAAGLLTVRSRRGLLS